MTALKLITGALVGFILGAILHAEITVKAPWKPIVARCSTDSDCALLGGNGDPQRTAHLKRGHK